MNSQTKRTKPKQLPAELDRAWFEAAYNGILNEAKTLPLVKLGKPGNATSNLMLKLASIVKGESNPGTSPEQAFADFMAAYPHRVNGERAYLSQWQRHMRRAEPRQRMAKTAEHRGGGETVRPLSPSPSPNGAAVSIKPPLDINTKYAKTDDYIKALDWLGYKFRLNEMGNIVEINGQRMSDAQEAIIRNRMADLGLDRVRRIEDAWMQVSWENRYHPIKEYLTELKWDGQDHITLLTNEYITDTTGFANVAFTRWLIGCIAKVFEHSQNFMMVWDGPQGIGKSHLARWLCPMPQYFVEGELKPDNNDHKVWATSNWIWEVGELQSTTRRADRESLKHFITQRIITVRKAYGKNEIESPMLANFVGTINDTGSGFLSDPTGNRRFVTLYLSSINHQYSTEIDVNQIWAQAMHQYRDGVSHHLNHEEAVRRDQINAGYETRSPLAEFFFDCYDINQSVGEVVTSVEIIRRLELSGLKGNQNQLLKDLAELMKRHRVKKVRVRGEESIRISGYTGILQK